MNTVDLDRDEVNVEKAMMATTSFIQMESTRFSCSTARAIHIVVLGRKTRFIALENDDESKRWPSRTVKMVPRVDVYLTVWRRRRDRSARDRERKSLFLSKVNWDWIIRRVKNSITGRSFKRILIGKLFWSWTNPLANNNPSHSSKQWTTLFTNFHWSTLKSFEAELGTFNGSI